MGLLDDYSRQALAYDRTRGVSEPISGRLREALRRSPGPALIDIGGGTGNYAAALRDIGFDPLVVDRSPAMLARAGDKGLRVLEAEAAELPLEDERFHAAILISMLHHVDDPGAALGEAKRVLIPGGILVAMVFTEEDLESLWVLDLFPSSRRWMRSTHRPRSEYLRHLPGAECAELALDDISDASLAALSSRPDLMLDRCWRSQTSYFERMERDHPEELADGLEGLAREVEERRAPDLPGRASLLTWTKPDRSVLRAASS